jgi:hypothetical protein
MRRALFLPFLVVASAACSAAGEEPTGGTPVADVGPFDAVVDTSPGDAGFNSEVAPMDAPPEVVAKVYANTDDTLWQMDPLTKTVTKIGAFTGLATGEDMTDIAVNEAGVIYGVSTVPSAPGHVYEITLPGTGTGAVGVTAKRNIPETVKFFALAFAPKGVLGADETLVAGDSNGTLWLVPTGGTAPTKIGDFGTVNSGDPGSGTAGNTWQLSGDLVFFSNGGAPVGIATIRACSAPTTCQPSNDVVVEIDMAQLAKKDPTANVRKRFLGAGTGYGRLFGVGAWNNEVFAFQRSSATNPAQLISVSLDTGAATLIRDFSEITTAKNGWSGAGVTTAAKISLPK